LEGTRDGRERRIHLGAQRRDDCHNHRRNQCHHHAILHRRRPSFVVQVPQDAVVYLRHHRLSPWSLTYQVLAHSFRAPVPRGPASAPTSTAWELRRLEGTRDGRERRIHLGAQRRDDCHNHRRNQRHHHAILHRRRPGFVVQVPQDAVVHLRHHLLSPWSLTCQVLAHSGRSPVHRGHTSEPTRTSWLLRLLEGTR